MIPATHAYPFGALHARQISAGDYSTKSGVSRGMEEGRTRRRGGWSNLRRRTIARKFTAPDAPYLGRRTCISARRSDKDDPPPTERKQSAQKIMCASVKASCPRPQTLSSPAARGKTCEARRAWDRRRRLEEDSRIGIVLCLVILDFALRVSRE